MSYHHYTTAGYVFTCGTLESWASEIDLWVLMVHFMLYVNIMVTGMCWSMDFVGWNKWGRGNIVSQWPCFLKRFQDLDIIVCLTYIRY